LGVPECSEIQFSIIISSAESRNLLFAHAGVQFNWRMTVPKKVQINFALKTPTELAKKLGVSKARLDRILAIVGADNSRKNRSRSGHVAFKSKSSIANSRSARRNNAKTGR
jgi:hypothetical protein